MAKRIYAAITSLDGYIEGAEGRAANTPALKRGISALWAVFSFQPDF